MQGTILQLVASSIIKMTVKDEVSDERPKVICTLNMVEDSIPAYLDDTRWAHMYLID